MKTKLQPDIEDALSRVMDYAFEKISDDTSMKAARHTQLLIDMQLLEAEFDV